ncbi:hypothetical protein RRG08_066291 [Elysia crispata]|uniref:Uncharacterized protein n=1 Tax=Elysia crispata TaxID=231223 RepID=A0AAE1AMD3_9GAST|nr:hypothetical protein RRG08_066291 [Elysia crispata]
MKKRGTQRSPAVTTAKAETISTAWMARAEFSRGAFVTCYSSEKCLLVSVHFQPRSAANDLEMHVFVISPRSTEEMSGL